MINPVMTAGISGGGQGGAGELGGSGGGGAGGTTPPPKACEKREGDECRWLDEACGCMEPQHCQVRGDAAKGTCVKRGERKLGETCKSPDDCREGTCDQRVCRSYCEDSCDDGKCLAATGADNKPIAGVNVCWKSCQVGTQDGCAKGSTCQVRDINGMKGAFCLPPENPCPTTEDGNCDEPTYCAVGTDSVDCSCEKAEGAMCSPVGKCGCPKGESCEISSSGALSCDTRKPDGVQVWGFCKDDPSCAASSTCTFNPYGTCKPYCETSSDCPGKLDSCLTVRDSLGKDIQGFKVCTPGCSDTVKCPEHHACVAGDDGPFCRPFKPEIPNGACSLTLQIGCEANPGTSCSPAQNEKREWITVCAEARGTVPRGGPCGVSGDCESGHLCVDHVCKRFCDSKENVGCDQGHCGGVSSGATAAPFGACSPSCTTDMDCVSGTHCGPMKVGDTKTINTCQLTTPLTTTCLTNNNRCDEPAPRGTGLCAAGSDVADCMGTTP